MAVVPMVGDGTPASPRRPLFAPIGARVSGEPAIAGITGFQYQVSDDGRLAIVEFTARNRSVFAQIVSSARADVKSFEPGRISEAALVTELRKHKRDFDFKQFGAKLP